MIIGYRLDGQDNDSWMLEDGEPPSELKCPKCGLLNDFNYINPFYKIKKKTYDYSHPYDVGGVVSMKFKEFCIREKYHNILFRELEWSPGFFALYTTKIIEFDSQRSGTTFTKYCDVCQNFEEVIGSNPSFLKNSSELEDGFYRTDLIFGSKNAKNPILIVGVETQEKLKREKFKGLVFKPIDQ